MGNPVTFFEVVGRDVEVLQSFYRDAFDWQIRPFTPIPNYNVVRTGAEGDITGGVGPAYDGGSGHATFYVGVANLEEALSKVESLQQFAEELNVREAERFRVLYRQPSAGFMRLNEATDQLFREML